VSIYDFSKTILQLHSQPYDLDDAVIRRLATRMMVDLPGEKERERTSRRSLAVAFFF
jgi:hypothetical protein